MKTIEKVQIYHNVWCCAYKRRYNAKVSQDWNLYQREHETVLMCLNIVKWSNFDTERKKYS